MTLYQPKVTLQRFFAGLAEAIFEAELGVADPPLIDYLSDLLFRFVRNDAVLKVRSLSGRPLADVSEMLVEAETRIGEARREFHRQIGDFTLFWTGMFPESLRRGPGALTADRYGDYCEHGKRAYRIASEITLAGPNAAADPAAEGEILERLSEEFEMCAYGLREVRREWEKRERDGDAPSLLWVS
ncbi:MAG: hypothetical protein U0935_01595 [Pirellulales bacterium]